MRVLLWWPGCTFAVADVASGIQAGLEANGIDLSAYRLDAHIEPWGHALGKMHALALAQGQDVGEPTVPDVLYHANIGVLERALRHDVDWVLMVSGLYQHPDFIHMLHRAGRKVALIGTESPYDVQNELNLARSVDAVFVNERAVVPLYRRINPQTYYLPAAWHPQIHTVQGDDMDVPAHDVVFVGSAFIERQNLMEAIDWTGINLGLYGVWELLGKDSPLRPYVRGEETPNARTAALYRAAKVGINLHRTSVTFSHTTPHIRRAESINPRCYELAACGRFFISDARAEVAEVFGSDLPTFTNAAEAEALIRKALAEPNWRADVAAACADRVKGHSWTQRAATLVSILDGMTLAQAA